jgi:outer membrane protein assembly factor BamA
MRSPATRPFLFLGLTGLVFGATVVGAQLPPSPDSCCPLRASCVNGVRQGTGAASPKIIIDHVTFAGPIHLPDSTIEPLVASLRQKEFDGNSQWLEEIEDTLRSPWLDQGYFKAIVSAQAVPLGGDGTYERFSIAARMDEGPQYRFGRVNFQADPDSNFDTYESTTGITLVRRKTSIGEGPSSEDASGHPVFPVEELRNLMPWQEGDILSVRKIRDGLAALNRLYGEHGYIDFVAQPVTDIDDEQQVVSLKIYLVEEKQFRIAKIQVTGLDASSENALTWDIKPGDVFNSELTKAFFDTNRSVLPAGASMSENLDIRRNVKNGTVDIAFRFSPCPRQ